MYILSRDSIAFSGKKDQRFQGCIHRCLIAVMHHTIELPRTCFCYRQDRIDVLLFQSRVSTSQNTGSMVTKSISLIHAPKGGRT